MQCAAILKSGARKGLSCGLKCKAGALFCGKHAAVAPCTVAPSDGTSPLDTLPPHVLDCVMLHVASDANPRLAFQSLIAAKRVCKAFHASTSGAFESLFQLAQDSWSDWPAAAAHSRKYRGMPVAQKLDLVLGMGCQQKGCQAARVVKVHWPIAVRMCKECFANACISTWRAKKELGVSEELLCNLDQLEVNGYNRQNRSAYRSYSYTVVLRRPMEEAMGCSIECCSVSSCALELRRVLVMAQAARKAIGESLLDSMAAQIMGSTEEAGYKPWCPLDPHVHLLLKSDTWQRMVSSEKVPDEAQAPAIVAAARLDVWWHHVNNALQSSFHRLSWHNDRASRAAQLALAGITAQHAGEPPMLPALHADWHERALAMAGELIMRIIQPMVDKAMKPSWRCNHCKYVGTFDGLRDHSRAKHPGQQVDGTDMAAQESTPN